MVGWAGAAQDRLLADVAGPRCGFAGVSRRRAKTAELLVLRHENAVLRAPRQPGPVDPADRVWLAALSRAPPSQALARKIFPVTPATLLAGTANWVRRSTIRATGASPADRRQPGASSALPFGCEGEPAVGIPPDPRRAHEARPRLAPSTVYEILRAAGIDPGAAPVRPNLAAVPTRPGRRDPRGRLPSCGHGATEKTVCTGLHRAWHPPDALRRGNFPSTGSGPCSRPATWPSPSMSGSRP